MDPFDFAIVSLATFRLSHMIAREDGPFDVFKRLRLWAGAKPMATPNGDRWFGGETVLSKLIICPLCVSVWAAAGLYFLWHTSKTSRPFIVALGASGASSAVEMQVSR